jgi:hypothetical protein
VGRRGGEGKSFFFAPLSAVFGDDQVQPSPEPGTYPLLGLETKRVVLLDDWSFDETVLGFSTQLRWLEGKPIMITRPQNQSAYLGHFTYRAAAPIFVTTKESHLAPLQAATLRAQEEDQASEASMLLRRLQLYAFTQKMPKPAAPIPPCGCCFAKLIFYYEDQWQWAQAGPWGAAAAPGGAAP